MSDGPGLSILGYMLEHRDEWKGFEEKAGLVSGVVEHTGWEFAEGMLSMAVFDLQYEQTKVEAAGFAERQDVLQNYVDTFELMKKARTIP